MQLQKSNSYFVSPAYSKIRQAVIEELGTRFEPGTNIWFARIPYTTGLSIVKPTKGILVYSNPIARQNNWIDEIHVPGNAQVNTFMITPDMIIAVTEQECIDAYNQKIQVICDYVQATANAKIAFLNNASPAFNTQERRNKIAKDAAKEIAAWQYLGA